MPKPKPGESKQDFVSRCMGNDTMVSDYPDQKQRSAICYKQFGEEQKMDGRITVYAEIRKVDDEQRMVFGYCSSEDLDSQGEIVKRSAIEKAWKDYMKFANVREMHQASAVGVTKEYRHDDDGTYIGVKVVDDRAWKFVKEGVYKGFSIGGRVVKKVKNVITEIVLSEISLVDRPANPAAVFSAMKVDGALVDALAEERIITINQTKMKKFVELDGVKYVEDPANPGNPQLDAEGNPIAFVEEGAGGGNGADNGEGGTGEEHKEDEHKEDEHKDEDGEKADKTGDVRKVKMPVTKDTMGVVTLAGLLDHADYLEELFEMNGKDTVALNQVKDVIKSLIATEAGESDQEEGMEMGVKTGDMRKMLDEFSKGIGDVVEKKLAPLTKSLDGVSERIGNVEKDVEKMKKEPSSPRPASGASPVEKTFDAADGGLSKKISDKRAEIEQINKEINDYSVRMKGILSVDTSRTQEMMNGSEELFTKYRNAQRELNDLLAGGQ